MAKKRKVRYGLKLASAVISTCSLTHLVNAVEVKTKIMSLSTLFRMQSGLRKKKPNVHVGADPGKDNIGSAVPVVIGLLGSSVTVLLLRWRLVRQRAP